jgi:hypothetical protein
MEKRVIVNIARSKYRLCLNTVQNQFVSSMDPRRVDVPVL